jgi:hypothetical protein
LDADGRGHLLRRGAFDGHHFGCNACDVLTDFS